MLIPDGIDKKYLFSEFHDTKITAEDEDISTLIKKIETHFF